MTFICSLFFCLSVFYCGELLAMTLKGRRGNYFSPDAGLSLLVESLTGTAVWGVTGSINPTREPVDCNVLSGFWQWPAGLQTAKHLSSPLHPIPLVRSTRLLRTCLQTRDRWSRAPHLYPAWLTSHGLSDAATTSPELPLLFLGICRVLSVT